MRELSQAGRDLISDSRRIGNDFRPFSTLVKCYSSSKDAIGSLSA